MAKIKTALFWAWSCTWGIVMTLIGAVGALALIIGGKQPLVFHGRIYFEIGRAWGAVSLAGAVLGFLYGLAALGVVGLLMALYAGIIALWVFRREIPQYAGGAYVDYDAIWFEGAATRRGEKCFSVLMCAKRKEASASFFFLQKNIRSAWERKDRRKGKLLMKK